MRGAARTNGITALSSYYVLRLVRESRPDDTRLVRLIRFIFQCLREALENPWDTSKAVVIVEIAVSKVVHRDSETRSWQHLGSKKEPR